jgi:phenylalanine-4-hydroxylase
MDLNRWMTEVADYFPAAHIVNIRDVISSEDQVLDWSHFDRIVYYRLYERICDVVQNDTEQPARA